LTLVAVILLLLLFASGSHVAVGMGLVASVLMLFQHGVPAVVIGQTAFKAINSYALVAAPFFLFAGDLMTRGSIAQIIVELVGRLVRTIRGGLALTVMISCVFFAAVSGSSVASAAAIGSATVKVLRDENYPAHFAAGLVAVGGTLGLMIPPSLSFILIGSMVGLPIDKLFVAGIVPGLFEALLLCITTVVLSRRRNYGTQLGRPDWNGFGRALGPATPALMLPVVIIGSIYAGIFTPTEVSAVAAFYAAFLCLVVYRTSSIGGLWEACKSATLSTAMLSAVVIGGSLLGFILTRMGFAADLLAVVKGANMSPWTFLALVNVVLLILGMFVDGVSMIVLTAPVLFQLANAFGVNPIHFAVIITANVEIATLTPPVGLNLFVMSGITKLPVEEVVRGVVPFYFTRLAALMLITYVPWLSLVLVS